MATRCFAFDPTETQEDDTKGLIMIPNVGNMSFYMSTMICDFASEILNQFALLVIENHPQKQNKQTNNLLSLIRQIALKISLYWNHRYQISLMCLPVVDRFLNSIDSLNLTL